MKSLFVQMQNLYSDRKGITGLETAIILIAFIVVAAVFAFTVMTTGLFSTEKAKTTAQAGIAEASSTFAPKGAIVAQRVCAGVAPAVVCRVGQVFVQLQPATGATGSSIALADLAFIYVDKNQRYATDGAMATGIEGIIQAIAVRKIVGDATLPSLLQEGEVAEIQFTMRPQPIPQADPAVITNLGSNTDFTIEIIPSTGGSLIISRKTPPELVPVMNLQ